MTLSVRKKSWPLKHLGQTILCAKPVQRGSETDTAIPITVECGKPACGFDANGSPRCKDHGGMIQHPDPKEED